jgi:hypothetical protein
MNIGNMIDGKRVRKGTGGGADGGAGRAIGGSSAGNVADLSRPVIRHARRMQWLFTRPSGLGRQARNSNDLLGPNELWTVID